VADWVHAAERAYVATATTKVAFVRDPDRERGLAAAGAIASHYLAIGTPRSLGLVVDLAGPGRARRRDDIRALDGHHPVGH
jgi:hypothetical protein